MAVLNLVYRENTKLHQLFSIQISQLPPSVQVYIVWKKFSQQFDLFELKQKKKP